ncbi:hypothetical protein PL8927_780184 [Planktothrix serta PCC 8927]|uniref:Uncharacterized protein n=1 Tax=Planktothrix serta PCC 8927 TaxID=671068 RepID=A0A7Z9BY74_9CYAN|nr:hypothetical protein PL8927_780184 [Planktothrix serta PCC 8927]
MNNHETQSTLKIQPVEINSEYYYLYDFSDGGRVSECEFYSGFNS